MSYLLMVGKFLRREKDVLLAFLYVGLVCAAVLILGEYDTQVPIPDSYHPNPWFP